MRIIKKIWPEYFEAVKSGEKKFEVRLADFKCVPGDVLVLKEWNPETKSYTGRQIEKQVSFVLNTKVMEKFHSKQEIEEKGLIVISFK